MVNGMPPPDQLNDRTVEGDGPLHLLDLPAELIGRAIIRVQQSLDGSSQQMLLAGLELVCKQMRVLVAEQELWRGACTSVCPTLKEAVLDVNHSRAPQWFALMDKSASGSWTGASGHGWQALKQSWEGLSASHRSSLVYKKLLTKMLATTEPKTLISSVHCTSSMGGGSSPENMLTKFDHHYDPIMHLVGRPHHWRSAPTPDQGGRDHVIFQLANPLCLVRGVKIKVPKEPTGMYDDPSGRHRPVAVQFHMGFQPESRGHAPRGDQDNDTRLMSGLSLELLQASRGSWMHSSAVYPFDQHGECSQLFSFPQVVCPGRLLKVDLIGKGGPPSQEHDVRIVYAKVLGVKIPGAAVQSRRLVVSGSLPRENRQWLARPETIDHGPRFDSSDSEAGEEAYPDFWHA